MPREMCAIMNTTRNTSEQYDEIVARCRRIYELKMRDYGPSWRIMRPQTVNDQLFIKAKRVREIEMTGVNMVGESVEGEMMAIVNYSIIGLIQLRQGFADSVDMTRERAMQLYDDYMAEAKALMLRKNHDYGEAWRVVLYFVGGAEGVNSLHEAREDEYHTQQHAGNGGDDCLGLIHVASSE